MIDLSINGSTEATKSFTEVQINTLIRQPNIDTNLISDGKFTFDQLYNYQNLLFILLCKQISKLKKHAPYIVNNVWKSEVENNDTSKEGLFILGIGESYEDQIIFYLPISEWSFCEFAETIENPIIWGNPTIHDSFNKLNNALNKFYFKKG